MKLKILNVLDKGKPNAERVRLKATKDDVNLKDFILMDDTFDDEHKKTNKHRHCYDFGSDEITLMENDRVVLHTCKGKDSRVKDKNDKSITVYHIYWGFEDPIWNEEGDTVHLVEVSYRTSKKV